MDKWGYGGMYSGGDAVVDVGCYVGVCVFEGEGGKVGICCPTRVWEVYHQGRYSTEWRIITGIAAKERWSGIKSKIDEPEVKLKV